MRYVVCGKNRSYHFCTGTIPLIRFLLLCRMRYAARQNESLQERFMRQTHTISSGNPRNDVTGRCFPIFAMMLQRKEWKIVLLNVRMESGMRYAFRDDAYRMPRTASRIPYIRNLSLMRYAVCGKNRFRLWCKLQWAGGGSFAYSMVAGWVEVGVVGSVNRL